MRVIVTGATGFIGHALCRELHGDYELIALSRDARKAGEVVGEYAKVIEWDARTASGWARHVEGAHAIVNLAGENIASGRWAQSKKASIAQSRTNSLNAIVDAISGANTKPAVVIQASAIGYYGSRRDEILDEDSTTGPGFLAEVCRRVESVVAKIDAKGPRCVTIRTGVVLGANGGALPKLMQPFHFYLGGRIGSGKRWFSWISLRDEIRAIRFLIENRSLKGTFNLTSPNAVTMKQFCRTLGEVLGKPAWTVVPGFAARLAFGEMADEVLLAGQKVVPKRLMEAGFEFRYPEVREALTAIVRGEEDELG